jgi:hypothetical protein
MYIIKLLVIIKINIGIIRAKKARIKGIIIIEDLRKLNIMIFVFYFY